MVLQTLNCIQAFLFFFSGTNELNVMATPSLARKTANMTRDLASQHAFFQILFLWTFELSQAWCGGHPYQEHHCKWMSPTWHFTDSLLVGSRVWLNRPQNAARVFFGFARCAMSTNLPEAVFEAADCVVDVMWLVVCTFHGEKSLSKYDKIMGM